MELFSIFINICCVAFGYSVARYKIYEKFINLNSFVHSFKQSRINSLFTSVDLIKESVFRKKSLSCEIKHDKKNKYIIYYTINGETYKININKQRGPQVVIHTIKDENEKDVTNFVKPLCGYNNDFHKQKYTPKRLGFNSLQFDVTDLSGEDKTLEFDKNEFISI